MSLRAAEQIADAVLYEGYVLYPYRASAAKNRLRWQVGLLMPRDYAEAARSDSWFMQTECLAEAGRAATLTVRVRCLHVQERAIERPLDAGRTIWQPTQSEVVEGRQLVAWDEAVVAEFASAAIPLHGSPVEAHRHVWNLHRAHEVESICDRAGGVAARIVRRRRPVVSSISISTERREPLVKIRVRVENVTPCEARTLAEREDAVRQSLTGTHTLLTIENGAFLSLLEPPPFASQLAAECRNEHTWPVLAGAPGARDVMLSSPIILYDYPAVAPESQDDMCDATEIDEMLMLRLHTLTDDEKREARATDDRAARIVDRGVTADAASMGSLHGAIRHFADAPPSAAIDQWTAFVNPPDEAPPEAASLQLGSRRISNGSRVRLKPSHRSDSLDMCLGGRLATVTGVYRTLENTPYVAVTLDDDPFGQSGARYRRALFFHPDELVAIETAGGAVD